MISEQKQILETDISLKKECNFHGPSFLFGYDIPVNKIDTSLPFSLSKHLYLKSF